MLEVNVLFYNSSVGLRLWPMKDINEFVFVFNFNRTISDVDGEISTRMLTCIRSVIDEVRLLCK